MIWIALRLLDLMSILCKLANIEIDSGDTAMNLPKCFCGQQEREFTYSESIFPGILIKLAFIPKNWPSIILVTMLVYFKIQRRIGA